MNTQERPPHILKGEPRPPIRFPGIVADAKALGVTRIHLYFVLAGERKSPGLLRRYQSLKSQMAASGQ